MYTGCTPLCDTALECWGLQHSNDICRINCDIMYINIIIGNLTVMIWIFTVKMHVNIQCITLFHTPHENTEDSSFPMIYHTMVYTLYENCTTTPGRYWTSGCIHVCDIASCCLMQITGFIGQQWANETCDYGL